LTLDGKIALIGEMIETKIRKEKELEYYQQQLEELTKKMFFLQKDVDLTNTIIDIIQSEKIIDIEQHMLDTHTDKLIGSRKK
jgi:hypothetical protein